MHIHIYIHIYIYIYIICTLFYTYTYMHTCMQARGAGRQFIKDLLNEPPRMMTLSGGGGDGGGGGQVLLINLLDLAHLRACMHQIYTRLARTAARHATRCSSSTRSTLLRASWPSARRWRSGGKRRWRRRGRTSWMFGGSLWRTASIT